MTSILGWLRGMRASNLVFLFAAPVILWLLATSRNYGPAISAVLGIEDQAPSLLISFLVLGLAGIAGFVAALSVLRSVRPDQNPPVIRAHRRRALAGFALQAVLLAAAGQTAAIDPYAVSIAINSADPRSVSWIVVVNQSFSLEPAFQTWLLGRTHLALNLGALFAAASAGFSALPLRLHRAWPGLIVAIAVVLLNFAFGLYVLMVAHAGFAVGLIVTLRAAFFAYIGAAILGLLWAFCGRLKPSRRATRIVGALGVVILGIGLAFFFKPHQQVALAGTLDGRIGIVAGTPQSLADEVRFGDFLAAPPEKAFQVRSLATVDQALEGIAQGNLSGALLPADRVGDLPVLWTASFLPGPDRAVALTGMVLGGLTLVLVLVGLISGGHPFAVFADFFVDTIRGVPMLVIILYVGLPLAGAIKNGTGGALDIDMMTRGIVAIAIGYSAYMAEIFRAGIEAIPKGQIEAARSLGLHEFQIARFVVVPQAIAIVLPALGNEFIAMLKDTALLSILSVRDLTQRMREFQAQSFLAFEPFNSAALLYILLTLIAASGIKSLDRIVNRSRSRD